MRGSKSPLSPVQQVEVWAWYCAKKELGSMKRKAREVGMTESALYSFLRRRRERAS